MQTHVKRSLFCVCIFLLCAIIIPKATDTVKETAEGMGEYWCNAFGEKGAAAQRFFCPFFEGEGKHTRVPKMGL